MMKAAEVHSQAERSRHIAAATVKVKSSCNPARRTPKFFGSQSLYNLHGNLLLIDSHRLPALFFCSNCPANLYRPLNLGVEFRSLYNVAAYLPSPANDPATCLFELLLLLLLVLLIPKRPYRLRSNHYCHCRRHLRLVFVHVSLILVLVLDKENTNTKKILILIDSMLLRSRLLCAYLPQTRLQNYLLGCIL